MKAPNLFAASIIAASISSAASKSAKKVGIFSTTGQPLQMFEVQVFSSGVNVAIEGNARQSSTLRSFAASNANDGHNNTFSHTNDQNPFWEVDLGESKDIEEVVVLNRYCRDASDPNGCLCRLSSATLVLLDDEDVPVATHSFGDTCNEAALSTTYERDNASVGVVANSVKIQSTTGQQLNMFEVQVFSSGVNVALQGFASQSSTLKDAARFAASNGVDGLTSTFSHTNDANAWWQLDLEAPTDIQEVQIVNRYCGGEDDAPGCLCRLSFAEVTLFSNDEIVSTRALGNTCEAPTVNESFLSAPQSSSPTASSVSTRSVSAKKIKLSSTTGQQLQIFEVQVFSSGVNVAIEGSARQSSTFKSFTASNANDGLNNTFSHTNDESPFWEIELSESKDIESIVILNRYCRDASDTNGCLCRLSSATLVLYQNDSPIVERTLGSTCGKLLLTETFSSIDTTSPTSLSPTSASPSASPSYTTVTELPTLIQPTSSITDTPTLIQPTSSLTDTPTLIQPTSSITDLPTQPTSMSPVTTLPTYTYPGSMSPVTTPPTLTYPTSMSPVTSSPINPTPLDSDFSSIDIGSPGVAGSASLNSSSGQLTVIGGGSDIWGTSDQFHYYYQEASVSTDEMTVVELYVDSLTSNQHEWTKGGLMIRESLNSNSRHFSLFSTGRQNLANQWRSGTGFNSGHTGYPIISERNLWLRITRNGDRFGAYYRRSNEEDWTQFGYTRTIPFQGSTFYVGVAVTSHDNSRTARLDASNVRAFQDPNPPTSMPTYFPTYWPTFHPTYFPTSFPTSYEPTGSIDSIVEPLTNTNTDNIMEAVDESTDDDMSMSMSMSMSHSSHLFE